MIVIILKKKQVGGQVGQVGQLSDKIADNDLCEYLRYYK